MATAATIVIQRTTYSLAGQAIAVRVTGGPEAANNGLFYLHSDHLGSASVLQNSDGTVVNEARYYPFGEYYSIPGWFYSGPNEITDRGFTGHRHNDDLGLIYMNARYYVKGIGRFASADTIVPDPANPQSLNRYTYVLNSPLKFIDPSGHCAESGDDTCWSAYDRLYAYMHAYPEEFLYDGSIWLNQKAWDEVGTWSQDAIEGFNNSLANPQSQDSNNWPEWTYSRWFPDYGKLDVTISIVSFAVTVDDYSNVYFTFAGNIGGDSPIASARLAGGWILLSESEENKWSFQFGKENSPSEEQFKRYLPGWSGGAGIGGSPLIVGPGGDISMSNLFGDGTGSVSPEVGIYSIQGGFNAGYTWDITNAVWRLMELINEQ